MVLSLNHARTLADGERHGPARLESCAVLTGAVNKPNLMAIHIINQSDNTMATITDTHKFIRRLRASGFDEAQAEAVAEAFQEAQSESLPVTRDYLDARLFEMENRLVKWGIGLALGQFAMIAALIKLL